MNTSRSDQEVAEEPFDFDELLGRCVGRKDLVEKVLANFTTLLPGQLDQLDVAARDGDLAKVRNSAHRLKGGALTISAQRLAKCALEVEAAANEERRTRLEECLADLRRESDRLTTCVRARLKKE